MYTENVTFQHAQKNRFLIILKYHRCATLGNTQRQKQLKLFNTKFALAVPTRESMYECVP